MLWSSILQFTNHGASIIITIILARILSPHEFGLVGMIVVITEFSRILLNFGFGQALIQKKEASPIDYSSVFWLNIVFGFILTVALFFSAGLIADFYNKKELMLMTEVLSASYLLASFGIVPQIILTRNLDFKSLAKIRVSAVVISGLIGILVAYWGGGVWALILIKILTTLLISLFSLILVPWKPIVVYSTKAIKSMFRFSVNLFGNETLNYWMDNLDKILIGRTLGDFALGLYGQAYSFMMLPVNNIARVINSVLFPSLSKRQDDYQYIAAVFEKSYRLVVFVTIPLLATLFVVTESFIQLLLGEEWLEMTLILKLLSITGIFYTLSEVTFSFFLAIGKSDSLFKTNLVLRIIIVLSVVIGLNWGLKGVAIALLATSPIKLVGMIGVLAKKIPIRVMYFFKNLAFLLIVSAIICFVGYFIHNEVLKKTILILRLVLGIIIVFLLYAPFIYIFYKRELQEIITFFKKITGTI